jgi:LytTr DNA-binding domain
MARKLIIEVFLVLVIGLVLGLFGPFGTYEMETAPRLAYWMVFGVAGYAIFRPLIIVSEWVSDALSISPLIGMALALVLAALPMTVLVALLLARFDFQAVLQWDGLGLLYFQVWLIGFLINGFFQLIFRERSTPIIVQPPSPVSTPPAPVLQEPSVPTLSDRLPPGFGPLLALKGEDHYVRAIGTHRQELLLIRLRDAMAELGSTDGVQVHRSWWVARGAIASSIRQGRALTLMLSNGIEVPVARDKAAQIKEMGWLKNLPQTGE